MVDIPFDPMNVVFSSMYIIDIPFVMDFECVILDPIMAQQNFEIIKKIKKVYEQNTHFKDIWATKLPWAESMVGFDGRVVQSNARCVSKFKVKKCYWFLSSIFYGNMQLIVARLQYPCQG